MILFKVTSRSRPQKLISVIENLQYNCRDNDYLIWCTLDSDDTSLDPIKTDLQKYSNLHCEYGISDSKVSAVNRDLNIMPYWDILVSVSDDFVFLKKDFDVVIKDRVYDSGGDCFIHFPESVVKSEYVVMPVVDRTYFLRDNHICHPIYKSSWYKVDVTNVAKLRNRYFYYPDILFEHNHPSYKKTAWDQLYHRNFSYYQEDQKSFKQRLLKKFT